MNVYWSFYNECSFLNVYTMYLCTNSFEYAYYKCLTDHPFLVIGTISWCQTYEKRKGCLAANQKLIQYVHVLEQLIMAFAQAEDFHATNPLMYKGQMPSFIHTTTLGLHRFDCNAKSKRTSTYRSNVLLLKLPYTWTLILFVAMATGVDRQR